MLNTNSKYAFEHWMGVHTIGMNIRANMVEIPGGVATIDEKDFLVGTFMISKSLVLEPNWGKVMGKPGLFARKPVTGVSFEDISDYLQRMRVPWEGAGYLTIPTEAQLELARQGGFIRSCRKYKEICLTQFKNTDDNGGHHYFDNLPKKEPFDLVVRQGEARLSLPYNQADHLTGFRLVLVDYYMTQKQISDSIRKALEFSPYQAFYTKKDGSYRLFFNYTGDDATICLPCPQCGCLMMFPDQVKDDTIVVSTDVIQLPLDMDANFIMDRIRAMNSRSMEQGIRYEVPCLFPACFGTNRVLVIKEFRAVTEAHVADYLPIAIEQVLKATGEFRNQFHNDHFTPAINT